VRNASLSVDLKIVMKTLAVLITGERQVLRKAQAKQHEPDLRGQRSSLSGT
jgi:hypothetical protein